MGIEYIIYEDIVISVKLYSKDEESERRSLYNIAIKYLRPKNVAGKNGSLVEITNSMGGETDWFILPYSFSVAVAKQLIEQKITGLDGFYDEPFKKMIDWLIEMNEISDAMSY